MNSVKTIMSDLKRKREIVDIDDQYIDWWHIKDVEQSLIKYFKELSKRIDEEIIKEQEHILGGLTQIELNRTEGNIKGLEKAKEIIGGNE